MRGADGSSGRGLAPATAGPATCGRPRTRRRRASRVLPPPPPPPLAAAPLLLLLRPYGSPAAACAAAVGVGVGAGQVGWAVRDATVPPTQGGGAAGRPVGQQTATCNRRFGRIRLARPPAQQLGSVPAPITHLGVALADHKQLATPLDDAARLAELLDARLDLHCCACVCGLLLPACCCPLPAAGTAAGWCCGGSTSRRLLQAANCGGEEAGRWGKR